MKKWCSHLDPESICEWNYCPYCGTPRPTEKSLEEKFKDYDSNRWLGEGDVFADLAKIAAEHYKDKGGV